MLCNKNSDENILFDLEYRGIQNFLIDLEIGLDVPEAMVPQLQKIILKHYELETRVVKILKENQSGHYCGVEYKDETICLLQSV